MLIRSVPAVLLLTLFLCAAWADVAVADAGRGHSQHARSGWKWNDDRHFARDVRRDCGNRPSSSCLFKRRCALIAESREQFASASMRRSLSKHFNKHSRHPGKKWERWFVRHCATQGPDSDWDGVPDAEDACINTPARARSLIAGCAAHEIVADPETIAAPLRRAYDRAFEILGLPASDSQIALFRPHREELAARFGASLKQVDTGLRALASANVCDGAQLLADARDRAEGARQSVVDALLDQWEELDEIVSADDTDADAAEVAFHEATYQASLLSRAISATGELSQSVDQVCQQVRRTRAFRTVVVATDEAAGVIEISNGQLVAIGDGVDHDPLYEGSPVSIRSNQFGDGHHGATLVSQLDSGITATAFEPDFPCSFLRIAPFQEFPPEATRSGPYLLHDPAGYRGDDGVYVVEEVTRFAAQHFSACPTTTDADGRRGTRLRYSLELQYRPFNAPGFTTFAADLRERDTPVALPVLALPPEPGSPVIGELRVIDKIATCRGRRCATPETHTVTDYPLIIYSRGDLVAQVEMNTLFDLEDWDTAAFEAGIVTGIQPASPLAGLPVAFNAQGWSIDGQRNLVTVSDTGNKFYAVYQDDFNDANPNNALAQHGTTVRSGLRWPRIVGTRGGWPFSYSANLPQIVRDRVGDCVPGPDAFYRMPWDLNGVYNVGQGNQSPPAANPANNPSHMIGTSQQFAFDFGLPSSTVVRAARGGTVDWFRTSQSANFDPNEDVTPDNVPFERGSQANWGNAVRIRHQDGTFAWYFHLENASIALGVNQPVQRGEPLALSDNTGRSGGPHLHFQVQADSIDWGQSIQIRFGIDCTIPQSGDDAFSDNANPNFP